MRAFGRTARSRQGRAERQDGSAISGAPAVKDPAAGLAQPGGDHPSAAAAGVPAAVLRWARVHLDRETLGARWREIWPWMPLVLAAGYAIVVLANLPAIIDSINIDSDVSIALMIGKLLGGAPAGSHVVLGDHPWYEELWFLRATASLPGYRQLWDIAPAAWSVLGIGILSWSAWRALGRWPAMLVASALLCLSAGGRFMFWSIDYHSLSVLHTVLIGALVVWLAGRARQLALWQVAELALVFGAISAAPASGDQLFLYWAIVPMLLTAVLLVWRTRAREHWLMLALLGAVGVIALVGGALLHQDMVQRGITAAPFSVSIVAPNALLNNLVVLVRSFSYLAAGNFFGTSLDLPDATMLISALLFMAALVCLPFELRRRAARSEPAPVSLDPSAARRFAYIAYWSLSLLITSAVFVLSSAPADQYSARYVLAGYVAVAALLPLLALRNRGWQVSVTAGVCVFALIASYQVIRQPFQRRLESSPEPWQATALARFAASRHVGYGYTSYWSAADLTWTSGFKVRIYPVGQCSSASLSICPYYIGISSWYRPRPDTRSMLILNSELRLPDPALGAPIATKTIGDLTALVYPYDIASRFGAH